MTDRSQPSRLGRSIRVAAFETLILAASAWSLPGTAEADVIKLVPDSSIQAAGGQINGRITAESPTEVTIQPASGSARKVPLDAVASIEYENLPPSYVLAEAREGAGDPDEAAKLYDKAAEEAPDRPFVARAAKSARARLLAEIAAADPSRADEARKALDEFVAAYPSARQIEPALTAIVGLTLQQGDVARASSALDDLSAKVPSASGRVAVLRARVQTRDGSPAEALKALDALLARSEPGSAQSREAMMAKAEALVASEQFADAEAVVLAVIKAAPPEDATLQAEAHNTLGDCLRAAGRPKDALIAYLKTDVLYDRDKPEHPRALAAIAQLWRELGRDDRADEVLGRLRDLYPRSPYATAAGSGQTR